MSNDNKVFDWISHYGTPDWWMSGIILDGRRFTIAASKKDYPEKPRSEYLNILVEVIKCNLEQDNSTFAEWMLVNFVEILQDTGERHKINIYVMEYIPPTKGIA